MTSAKEIKNSLSALTKPYPGEWVALTQDESKVVGHSLHLKTAVQQAHDSGEKFPYIVKSSTEWTAVTIF